MGPDQEQSHTEQLVTPQVAQPINHAAPADDLIQFSEHSSFNFAMVIAWLAVLLAILGTLYFWWMDRNLQDQIAEQTQKKTAIEDQINSSAYKDITQKAQDFKSSVNVLREANKNRYSMVEFLNNLYTKITNDTEINALSVTDSGTLSLTGKTKSYRTTGDLIMALKSWSVLEEVKLDNVALQVDDGKAAGTAFAVSAKINKSLLYPTTAAVGTTNTTVASPSVSDSSAAGIGTATPAPTQTTGGQQ